MLYSTDYPQQHMACQALVAGPPGQALSLQDRAHLAKSLVDLAASHHPYEPLAAAEPSASGMVAAELQAAAWAALQVVQGEAALGLRPAAACEPPQRCHADGCSNSTAGVETEVCGLCGVAVFCSPRCARAGRLGRHASCVLEALNGGSRLGASTAVYLSALMAGRPRGGTGSTGSGHCGSWRCTWCAGGRQRGPMPWGPHDEDEGTGDNLPPPHVPGVVEASPGGGLQRRGARAGGLPVGRGGAGRGQWLEDPLPEWGLGAAVPRVVHLFNMVTSERPPGCGGAVVWSEGELQRHAAQLARCTGAAEAGATAGGGGGGELVMRGYTELCFNAAADFPCPAARASCLDAAVALHALAVRAPHAALQAAAAGALQHLSAAGLQALLARPPQSGAGKAKPGRREVALGCALKLMALVLAGGQAQAGAAGGAAAGGSSLAAALQSEWSGLLGALERISGGGGGSAPAQQSLMGALAELVAVCGRQGLLQRDQLQAAEALLRSKGIAVSAAVGDSEPSKPAVAATAAPAAASARPEPGIKVCARCGAAAGAGGTRLRKCSRCQAVRYCSEACQTAHWAAGHERECKQLAAALAAAAAAGGSGGRAGRGGDAGPVEVD
ncbi:hypothetical protein HXX76_012052 [Chlamydomonas incerta]|uniref:MYND-type domain-containing protein n=1 Tax=Chlamydomonas incerta TaxID=51695 RepID=A0A835SMH0_CHLIN|nr:hypothetical protein HXX76_012052 [Chlamydomonas incerta]|eukprot:KAG2427727.1 hypothetical protein HXX76_012052 [Chlamydomonas incerta]